jgi:CIC family chloride channel protein
VGCWSPSIALAVPQVLGGGHGAIQDLFDHDPSLWFPGGAAGDQAGRLGDLAGAGFRGGMFSSSLLLGCVFGAAFGEVLGLIAPGLAGQQPVLMLVGMASVAAAVIGSPLTMVFLVLEGTDNFPVTVGVMVGVIIASTIVRLSFGYSFSTWRFHQRGIGVRSAHDIGWLADLTVGRLMRADPKTELETAPLAELREKYPPAASNACSSCPRSVTISARSTSRPCTREKPPDAAQRAARDFARDAELHLLPYENVRTALSRFEDKEAETLPVLESATDRKVVGYLTEQYALRRYNQELERRRGADLGQRDLFSIAEPPR